MAHAYLFQGPEGVGKKLFAKRFATLINCSDRHSFASCGQCASCKKMAVDGHPDFILIAPEKGSIKIDQIRELIKALSFAPYEAKNRVVLIEDVHAMRHEAANSLLKTLEEPPENNILILTADSAANVIQTILSRCQVVPFYSLTVEETVQIIVAQEREMPETTAKMLACLGEGSPGKGLMLYLEDVIALRDELIAFLGDAASKNEAETGRLLLLADKMATLKEKLPQLLGLVRLWLRDGLLAVCGKERWVDGPKMQKEWNSKRIFAKLNAVNRAEKELLRNCNRTLVCEVLLFQLLK